MNASRVGSCGIQVGGVLNTSVSFLNDVETSQPSGMRTTAALMTRNPYSSVLEDRRLRSALITDDLPVQAGGGEADGEDDRRIGRRLAEVEVLERFPVDRDAHDARRVHRP